MIEYNTEDVIKYEKEKIFLHCKEHYEGIKGITETDSGTLNLCFKLFIDNEERFGKLHNPKKEERRIILENEFSYALLKRGMPVPRIIKTRTGEDYAKTSIGLITLYESLDGLKYSSKKSELKGAALMQSKIHNLDLPDLVNIFNNEKYFIDNLEPLILRVEELRKRISKGKATLEDAIKYLEQKKIDSDSKKTIIHADYHPWNLKFDKKGNVCGIFDFDYVQQGRTIYDLAVSLVYFTRTEKNEFNFDTALKKAKEYIRYYTKNRKISKAELRDLPSLIIIRALHHLVKDLENKDLSYKLNFSNIRNLQVIKWALNINLS